MTEENYLEVVKNKTISFCHQLVSSGLPRTRALAGLLLSLSSNVFGSSVVQLSLNPCFQHQYSSVFDVIDQLVAKSSTLNKVAQRVRRHCWQHGLSAELKVRCNERMVVSLDATPRPALFSYTLPDRQSIQVPNPTSHQPYNLSEGYNLSSLHLAGFDGKWSLPLAIERVGIDETSSTCGRRQLTALLRDSELVGPDTLVVNAADNGYANAPFLRPLYDEQPNLVNVCRLKRGSKTYARHPPPTRAGDYQRQWYGPVAYNIMESDVQHHKGDRRRKAYSVERTSISEVAADEELSYVRTMGVRQREVIVKLSRWNDRLLKRNTSGSMKDKPVDIVRVVYTDGVTGKSIYKHEMYLVLSGQRRREVTTLEAHGYYISRSDMEAYYRVSKRRLLLDKHQPGKLRHLDSYLLVVQMASWLSYLTAAEATRAIYPWERYLPPKIADEVTPQQTRLTMSQAIRGAPAYYATLDLRPFAPPKQTGGTGRRKGAKQPARKRYRRVKKMVVKG